MFDNFGFDPKTLSDNELFTKQIELSRRKSQAHRLGRMETVMQLDALIFAIETERRERMFLDRWNKIVPETSVLIETDPGLQETQEKAEEAQAQKAQPVRPVRRPVRSSNPVLPTDGTK
jgi:hypothetical protein